MLLFRSGSAQATGSGRSWMLVAIAIAIASSPTRGYAAGPSESEPAPTASAGEQVDPPQRDEDAARQAYERARTHFAAEEFLAAAEALREAYALDPQVDYLYQRGHALRLAGGCAGAIEVFERVEAQVQAEAQRAEVQRWIEHCRDVVRAAGAADDDVGGDANAVDATVEPMPSDEDRLGDDIGSPPVDAPPPRKDVLAGALLGVGSTVAVAGAGMVIGASVVAGRDVDRESEPDYERRAAQVRTLQVAGGVALGVGLAVVVGAVARYGILVARRRRAADRAGLSVGVDAGGVRLRF